MPEIVTCKEGYTRTGDESSLLRYVKLQHMQHATVWYKSSIIYNDSLTHDPEAERPHW